MKAYLVRKELLGIVSRDIPWLAGSMHHKSIAAWEKKHSMAVAEIVLHVSPTFITHCDDMDAVSTWNKLRLLFHTEGHGSVAVLHWQFNSMQYEMGMLMWDWVTKVEDWAQHLDDINSPMIPIDIIITLILH